MPEGGRGIISRGMQEANGLKKETTERKKKKIGIGCVSRGDNGDGVRACVYLRSLVRSERNMRAPTLLAVTCSSSSLAQGDIG